jgi:hypothetical protein
MSVKHLNSLKVPHIQEVSPPQHGNYATLSLMRSIANEKEPLTVCLYSLDLVLVVDMVTPSLGTLELVLHSVDQSESLDMYSFQSIILLSNEDLLEAMVNVHEHSSLSVSSSLKNETENYEHSSLSMAILLKNETDNYEHSSLSVSSSLKNETVKYEHSSLSVSILLKNETDNYEHSSLSVSSSLKNESYPPPIESSLPLDLVLEPSFPPLVLVDPLSSSLSSEPIPISSQKTNQVQKKIRQTKRILGGMSLAS